MLTLVELGYYLSRGTQLAGNALQHSDGFLMDMDSSLTLVELGYYRLSKQHHKQSRTDWHRFSTKGKIPGKIHSHSHRQCLLSISDTETALIS